MFEKFVSIKNVGRFRNYNARGDVTFRKLTLLFAENGQGKTTICAILRSLQDGQDDFISERQTLGSSDSPLVQIRLNGNSISYTNNTWSSTHPELAIFDSVFVHDNVYAGDYVDHNHKKNLYRVIIGAQGVQLAQQVDDLDGQIRDSNTDIRTKKDLVSKNIPQGVTIVEYLGWQPIADIEVKIQQKIKEIATQERAVEKAGEIQAKSLFAKIQIPSLPSDFTTILSKQLTDIATDAETLVKEQIAQHQMGSLGESWLSQGIGYIRNDLCPFCGQAVSLNELIAAYKSHFNVAYKALKQEVAQLSNDINNAIGETTLHSLQQILSGNVALTEFWKQFVEASLPDFPHDEVQQKIARLRELSLSLAKKKQENPIEPISLDADFSSSVEGVEKLKQLVETYNTEVDACNTRINEQKASVQRAGAIRVIKNELADLEAKKKRFEPDVIQACQEYEKAIQDKTQLEGLKQRAKDLLNQYCEDILKIYEQSINEYLDQFNTGFRIVNTKHQYTGGKPSSHYQIAINNCPVDLGDSKTPAGMPCFRTTLSAGDRSALALAFFLASLKQDPDIGNKIVVLDDPFTSLDRFRRTCTQQLIRKLADQARQVIVLSHDPQFLKLVWDGVQISDVKVLQMSKAGDSTVIGEWDVEIETQSGYLRDYSTLLDFYVERRGDPLSVARTIRPFLEGWLRRRFPGRFQQNEWLGDFINKIRSADPNGGLSYAQADLGEIEDINDYSKKYHHDQNQNADSEPINSDELHGFVKRTHRLVGGD